MARRRSGVLSMGNAPTMQSLLETAVKQAREKAQRDKDEAILKFYGQMFDKASAYTNLIVGAGYGGIFAVWSEERIAVVDQFTGKSYNFLP